MFVVVRAVWHVYEMAETHLKALQNVVVTDICTDIVVQ